MVFLKIFHALAKSDNTISESVDAVPEYSQPSIPHSEIITHAKSANIIFESVGENSLPVSQFHTHDYTIPKSVDVHSQPIANEYQLLKSDNTTPESQVLFPYPNLTRLPHEMLNSPWVTELKEKLDAAKIGKQITYVTVSMNYFPVLINWMIHAKLNAMPLLENLLVVSTDKQPDEILSQKGVLSQYVPITDILYTMENTKIFSARIIVRMTILRLLNYWGYDVLLVDIDAILMNNIQPILDHFHDSDIIESTVNFRHCLPRAAYAAWKFCLNIGLLLMRSNAKTEKLLQVLSNTPITVNGSDQTRLSNVLIKSNMTWTPFDYDSNHYIKGTTPNEYLTVIGLPQQLVCRNECNVTRLSSYYVWHAWSTHRGGGKQKVMTAQKVWKLKEDWESTLETVQSSMDWLDEVIA